VAFWNGQSKGTEHTIGLAIEKRKPVAVFNSLGTLIRFIDEEGTVFAPNWGTDERTKHPEGRQGS